MRAQLLIVLAACGGSAKLGEQDRARLEAALATADARAASYLQERTLALREAVATPPELEGPCTVKLPAANALARTADGKPAAGGDDAHRAATHFSLLPGWALSGGLPPANRGERERMWARLGLEGTPHGQFALTREYFAKQLERGSLDAGETADTMVPRIELLAGSALWGWELVIVTESWEPGRIRGQAFVWSYDQHRLACAGAVDATGGADLEARAFAAAITNLHALRK